MHRLCWISIAALLSTANAAHAEWQYTKWSMTPAEVVSASKGEATLGSGEAEDVVPRENVGAVGTYVSGDYRFKVVFYFREDKLVDIRLGLIAGTGPSLKNSLMGQYGLPFDDTPSIGLTTWRDSIKNNRVDLLRIGSSTNLEYRPLVDASASGL